eukprot:CAMPEP_0202458678 /NCGR_PEP_ID=MMETSP1360-20130828/26987_1 /ASSEMBLY_ACC=CAM_ASM_000848 /TAXON_ID=515479 /ORGANISM="Licmophora paradoxa, Strain CCMP2313" /LENGTH=374 /DNA_ID=CAMNT_0049079333 /DNA_START=99 /DNA_END=1223 /DNA_ORIENTATION=+
MTVGTYIRVSASHQLRKVVGQQSCRIQGLSQLNTNQINHPQTQSAAIRSYSSLNNDTPFNICFLRHGQSTWNRDNRFIGWTDTPLTDDGVLEARLAGQMLRRSGMLFDEVHTSLLRRSIRTCNLVLMELGQEYLPVHKHWRLNERNYGDLVGKNKKEVVRQFGQDQVKRWRRSFDEPPPPMSDNHKYHPARDPRYRLMMDKIPKSESLKDTRARSSVYWDEVLDPELRKGKTLLVVGHENNLRSLIMRLEDIPEEDVINLSLPRAVPLAYRLDENLKPLDRPDGKLDEATGFLKGTWLGGDNAVAEILDRDDKQVYDTSITHNLETDETRDEWKNWMSFAIGEASPEQKAKTLPGHCRAKAEGEQGGLMSSTSK